MYSYCPNCGFKLDSKTAEFICLQCEKKFYTNSRPTATVIPIYNDEILVGVRAHDPQKGMYDFFGGFLNNGEHPIDGAVREFKEETGVEIDRSKLEFVGVWMDEYSYQDDMLFTLNMIYLLPVEERISVKVADDVESFKWIKLAEKPHFAFKHQNQIFDVIQKK